MCGRLQVGKSFLHVSRLGRQQFGDPFAPDWRDNTKLGKLSSDRIIHCGLLADEQMACAVKHQATLLLRRLGWHEPHIGPGDSFTDGLSVSGVVLLPFNVRLHVGRRASAARYGQVPGARVTNGVTRHRLRCRSGMAATSRRTPGLSGASTDGG